MDLGDPRRVRRLGISTIYQELSLVAHLSVAENVYLEKHRRSWAGVVDGQRMHRDASRILAPPRGGKIDPAAVGVSGRSAADGRGRARLDDEPAS